MKTTLLLATAFILTACAGTTPPTPEQIAAYSNAIHNGLRDYKEIRRIEKTP